MNGIVWDTEQLYECLKKYSGWIMLEWLCIYLIIRLRNEKSEKRVFLRLSAIAYVLVFLFITLLGREPRAEMRFQLEFLWEYRQAFAIENMRLKIQSQLWVGMIVNNIILFIPFGIFTAEGLRHFQVKKMFPIILAVGLFLSCFVEMVQLILRIGLFETDDILNNSIGAVFGYFWFLLADKLAKFSQKKHRL